MLPAVLLATPLTVIAVNGQLPPRGWYYGRGRQSLGCMNHPSLTVTYDFMLARRVHSAINVSTCLVTPTISGLVPAQSITGDLTDQCYALNKVF